MKKLRRAALIFLCIGSLLITEITFGQQGQQNDNGDTTPFKVTRYGLVFWGSVLTFASRKGHLGWFLTGWLMIVSGFASSSSNVIKTLVLIDNTELDMYAGRESPENLQARVFAGPLLEKIEMDALMAVYSSKLAQHLPMVEVLNKFHMDPRRVGQLILNAKILGDAALNGKEFGDKITIMDPMEVKSEVDRELSPSEMNVVKNYLRLRNIVIGKK